MTNIFSAESQSDPAPRRSRCRDDEIAAVGRRAVLLVAGLTTAGLRQVPIRGLMRGQWMTTTEGSSVVSLEMVRGKVGWVLPVLRNWRSGDDFLDGVYSDPTQMGEEVTS